MTGFNEHLRMKKGHNLQTESIRLIATELDCRSGSYSNTLHLKVS